MLCLTARPDVRSDRVAAISAAAAMSDTARVSTATTATISIVRRLPRTAKLLIACRAVRSIGQGALVADFAFYLAALHWTPVQMGAVYMGGLMLGAAMTLAAGPLSDRFGRKPFLLAYAVAQVLAAAAALLTAAPVWLVPAALIGAFGRGANGAAGPFGPVEQAWLADGLDPADFGPVYSLNAAVGFAGMGTGALLAALPAWWRRWLPGPLRFRPLFLLVLLGALASLILLLWMTEASRSIVRREDPSLAAATRVLPEERGMLLRLVGINALNGFAIGMIGPFMAYWFHLRFGEGTAQIGPVLALGFFVATFSSVATGWLARRLGTAMSVVAMRLAGLVLFVLLPFAPSYGLAATCYVLRAACNRGTSGARQAVGLKLVGPGRRGLAASLNAISMQVPRALGPLIGGLLLESNLLALPFLFAAGLQAVYLALYGRTFRAID
jgi:MFS family permease